PYSMVKVVAPAFYSVDRPRVPLLASVCAVAANVTFNALTYRALGAPGLALGTSLAALVNVTILRLAFARVVGPMRTRPRELLWLLLACVALGAVVWLGDQATARLIARLGAVAPSRAIELVARLVALALIIASGFLVYTALLRRVGYPGAAQLARLPGALVRRLRSRT
ncbi:MAG: polysaccharide biosynthesis C-terminal domain-containing protein, partial [Myxococcales bacterium]|nr:polysaccharide biosynthesis C-terminal domain-containing protein [Myxococcales bacterium]